MLGLGNKQRWATAAATALVLLVPVFYAPAHTCLHQQSWSVVSPAGKNHKGSFCTGCVFQWLSLFWLQALAMMALPGSAPFAPALRPLFVFIPPASSPTGRAPPRLP